MKNKKELYAQWYIITVIRGKEEKVVRNLISKIKTLKYDQNIFDIKIVKTEKVEETIYTQEEAPKTMKNSQNITWETIVEKNVTKYKRTKKQIVNKFPGYVFIKMILDDELWFIIRNTELVTGLVGSSGKNSKPIPISEEEVEMMLKTNEEILVDKEKNESKERQVEETTTSEEVIIEHNFKVNNEVVFTTGAFKDEEGKILSLNDKKNIATVEVYIMGQKITVDTPLNEIVLK